MTLLLLLRVLAVVGLCIVYIYYDIILKVHQKKQKKVQKREKKKENAANY